MEYSQRDAPRGRRVLGRRPGHPRPPRRRNGLRLSVRARRRRAGRRREPRLRADRRGPTRGDAIPRGVITWAERPPAQRWTREQSLLGKVPFVYDQRASGGDSDSAPANAGYPTERKMDQYVTPIE